jgi:hypothetical protein
VSRERVPGRLRRGLSGRARCTIGAFEPGADEAPRAWPAERPRPRSRAGGAPPGPPMSRIFACSASVENLSVHPPAESSSCARSCQRHPKLEQVSACRAVLSIGLPSPGPGHRDKRRCPTRGGQPSPRSCLALSHAGGWTFWANVATHRFVDLNWSPATRADRPARRARHPHSDAAGRSGGWSEAPRSRHYRDEPARLVEPPGARRRRCPLRRPHTPVSVATDRSVK